MQIVLLLLTVLLGAAPAQQGDPIDRILGAWQARLEHDGETRDLILEFVRSGNRVLMVASTPAIHAWRFPVAIATMSGSRVAAGPASIDYDPSADTLTPTIPAELIPRYAITATFHRRDAIAPPDRPAIAAPVRQPIWTAPLGAPAWADVAFIDGQVIAGTDDGRLHAFDIHGRERWTFKAGGAIRARATPLGHDLVLQADD